MSAKSVLGMLYVKVLTTVIINSPAASLSNRSAICVYNGSTVCELILFLSFVLDDCESRSVPVAQWGDDQSRRPNARPQEQGLWRCESPSH